MRALEKIRMRLQMLLHRGRESDRLAAELEFHLEQQIAEDRATGMGPEEARQAALRTFGNPVALREQARESWSWNGLEALWRDVRIGAKVAVKFQALEQAAKALNTFSINFSAGGLCLRTKNPHAVGDRMALSITITSAHGSATCPR